MGEPKPKRSLNVKVIKNSQRKETEEGVKVTVKAAGTVEYKSASKTVTVTVRVK